MKNIQKKGQPQVELPLPPKPNITLINMRYSRNPVLVHPLSGN